MAYQKIIGATVPQLVQWLPSEQHVCVFVFDWLPW